jgi:hypothetical protein
MSEVDDDEEVWNERELALAGCFGCSHSELFHSPHPFVLGGNADVLSFEMEGGGVAYVTAELTGRPEACYADYELMTCSKSADTWGPNIISQLAPYTQQRHIGHAESMNIDSGVPDDATVRAFLFVDYARIELFGHENTLRLCIGITEPELNYKFAHNGEALLKLLKENGVYPFTDLYRSSVPLDA